MKAESTLGRAPLPDPTIIFLHIGKTGGTTLRKILRRQFPPSKVTVVRARRRPREETLADFAQLPESDRARPRLILGHTVFGLHELVPRPTLYITLVRDPISLVLSQYAFVLRTSGHRHHDEVLSKALSLEDYIRSGISLEMDNSQTRAISGDLDTPFGQCSEAMLERAKHNIQDRFVVIGLTERFDQTLVLLKQAFGWTRLHYVRANVARDRDRPRPDPGTIEAIRHQNRLDLELYRFVGERMDRAIEASPTFGRELERFERSNRLYRPLGTLIYTWPQKVFRRFARKDGGVG